MSSFLAAQPAKLSAAEIYRGATRAAGLGRAVDPCSRGISMRLEVETPRDSRLRAHADSGGIDVRGIKGPVDCHTDSGGIHASEIDAEVRAAADSGGIHVRRVNGPVYVRADSGGIEALEIAGSVDAEVDFRWRPPLSDYPGLDQDADRFRRRRYHPGQGRWLRHQSVCRQRPYHGSRCNSEWNDFSARREWQASRKRPIGRCTGRFRAHRHSLTLHFAATLRDGTRAQ